MLILEIRADIGADIGKYGLILGNAVGQDPVYCPASSTNPGLNFLSENSRPDFSS